ncbi:hypothetical protein GCM10010219_60660 [Streptomyces netropsis]|nr:hypothetical protein GCM10010219_60660 [Streptomyces netropsis]
MRRGRPRRSDSATAQSTARSPVSDPSTPTTTGISMIPPTLRDRRKGLITTVAPRGPGCEGIRPLSGRPPSAA